MIKTDKSSAYLAAVAMFKEHAEALQTVQQIHRQSTAVGNRLEELGQEQKPDFARISSLHSERQHLADRLFKTNQRIKEIEGTYERHGFALYNEALRFRDLACDAAIECARARLAEDFTGDVIDFVIRRHSVVVAEDLRHGGTFSPRDLGTFQAFAEYVPQLLKQIAQAERRIAIYTTCTDSRTLPDQKKLDAATPEESKPAKIAPRRELTPAEQRERDEASLTEEGRRLRRLHAEGVKIAGAFGENAEALDAFVRKHPEMAPYFKRRAPIAAAA